MHFRKHHESAIWKGLAGGIAGGLVASFVMNQFQAFLSKMEESLQAEEQKANGAHGNRQGAKGQHQQQQQKKKSEEDDDATVKAAKGISEGAFGHVLTSDEKKIAGPAVHYAFGTLTGALYGAAAELAPATSAMRGLAFGTAVWLAADEVAVPALKLSKPPQEVPPGKHVQALASHFVYGLTTDAVRRWVREVL